jgi:hypothetical protein
MKERSTIEFLRALLSFIFVSMKIELILGAFIYLFISSCGKDNCDDSTKNLNVDKNYLTQIIPYNDTSTRLFLKNGKDTLVFRSQGLQETTEFYQESAINGLCRKYNMQKLSLTMAASDTDFFEINYFADYSNTYGTGFVKFIFSNFFETKPLSDVSYLTYYPPVLNETVLNMTYDSVTINKSQFDDIVISKTRVGVLKVKSKKYIYELIK